MGWSGDKLEATCAIALGPGHRKKECGMEMEMHGELPTYGLISAEV